MESNGKAHRPVNKDVNNALGELPNGAFNFGLFFNKWFFVDTRIWKCHTVCPAVKGTGAILLLNNLDISIKLFNGDKPSVNGKSGSWDSSMVKKELEKKSKQLDGISAMYEKMGYVAFRKEVSLASALVIGLGNEHPTEKGFRFDWTTGSPFIPSSSIKGVVRLAYLVNELRSMEDEKEAEIFCKDISDGKLSDDARMVFGSGELKRAKQDASRGKVIFLDAFPVALPRLKPEIMTCHYKDYLMDGKRGPTEDQQPNPQQFWAVSPYLDENGEKPLKFIFRMLVPKSIEANSGRFSALKMALNSALSEHGLGAKTAIGHGRFDVDGCSNKDKLQQNIDCSHNENTLVQKNVPTVSTIVETEESWPSANLTWSPGDSMLTAAFQGKKAQVKGKDLVPTTLNDRLFVKKKPVPACVEIMKVGNKYVITRISEISKLG
jgi:CRISPR-associated protein Cmr6